MADAAAVFERNVRDHPDAPNPHDSLGEAYLRAGRVADAVASYRRAVALADAAHDPAAAQYHAALDGALRGQRTP